MIRFGYTILYVPDVVTAIAFYEKAFGFKRKFIAPEQEYGELDTGATTLSFCKLTLATSIIPGGFIESSAKGKPFGIEIGFVTDEVEKTYAAVIKAGATEVAKPEKKPWGQLVSYVRDPHGFLLEICSPME